MILDELKEVCETVAPDLTWTVRKFTEADDTGTVFIDGGDSPHHGEPNIEKPAFGILIRTSDLDKGEAATYELLYALNKRFDEIWHGYLYKDGRRYKRITYQLMSMINRAGILELGLTKTGVYEYKLIFDTRLFKMKEEEI